VDELDVRLIYIMKYVVFVAALLVTSSALFAQEIDDPARLADSARKQVGVTKIYDPAYVSLSYPGGDVPIDRGVCTDVVIRALRDAIDFDLQKAVHEDMRSDFASYPKNWDLGKPDKNIDHRRVLNLMTFFTRHAQLIPPNQDSAAFLPGDLVTCTVPPNLPHIMIVSNKTTPKGEPLVIHNIGRGAQEEDRLFSFPHTGHYRLNTAEQRAAANP